MSKPLLRPLPVVYILVDPKHVQTFIYTQLYVYIYTLTEETSTGNKNMMTNERNHTINVDIVTNGFCLLRSAYLWSIYRAKRNAKMNSTVRIIGGTDLNSILT